MNNLSTILCRHCGKRVRPYLSASLEERAGQSVLVVQAECPVCNTIHEGVTPLSQATLVYSFADTRLVYGSGQVVNTEEGRATYGGYNR